jgi:hypothetical protein
VKKRGSKRVRNRTPDLRIRALDTSKIRVGMTVNSLGRKGKIIAERTARPKS